MEKQKIPSAPVAPTERLARLLKEKEVVDQKIEKLTARDKERVKSYAPEVASLIW